MRATRGASSATSARGGRRPQTMRNQPVTYEDFTPSIEKLQDESSHIVLIHLPGFTKDKLKIVADSNRRILIVRGERLVHVLGSNVWARFQEEIPVPRDSQITMIRAQFEDDILRITMPKSIRLAAAADDLPLPPPPQPVVRRPSPPRPPPPQQLEEPQHVSPPSQLLPPLVRTPSPPPLKAPEPPVLPPTSPQIPQSQLPHPAADHDLYHDAPANNITQEKQVVNDEEPKLLGGVLRPRPTDEQQQQTTFGSSTADQEDHHPIAQPKSHQPPSTDHQEEQIEQLLADSHLPKQSGSLNAAAGRGIIDRQDGGAAAAAAHEEIMTRRRHVQHGVEDKGAPVASPKLKENGKAGAGGVLYGNGWKRMLMEERQLAVNAGVAILVAFSLGAYVSYSLLSPGKSNN